MSTPADGAGPTRVTPGIVRFSSIVLLSALRVCILKLLVVVALGFLMPMIAIEIWVPEDILSNPVIRITEVPLISQNTLPVKPATLVHVG